VQQANGIRLGRFQRQQGSRRAFDTVLDRDRRYKLHAASIDRFPLLHRVPSDNAP
jgi:hypothetical protein